jgi:aminoglycoside phosphotransferase (APT) family kinase protein
MRLLLLVRPWRRGGGGVAGVVNGADQFRRFIHGDLQPANIMAARGDYTAVIDWGDAGWADPALELATLPMRAVPHALAGYREVAPLDGDDTAEARIWWDHVCAAVYNTRRRLAPDRVDWNRPPAARLVELLAYVHDGGRVGRFAPP